MLAAASGPLTSAACATSEDRYELARGMELVCVEGQVEGEDKASVEAESEVTHFTLGTLVKVWLLRGNADNDVGVSIGLTTIYDEVVAGEGVWVTS